MCATRRETMRENRVHLGLFMRVWVMAAVSLAPFAAGVGSASCAPHPHDRAQFPGGGASTSPWSTAFCVPGPDSLVRATLPIGDSLVIGGAFDHVGALSARSIALYDGHAWHALGDGLVGEVYALLWWHGQLLAGGTFTQANGASATYVAAWDGASWTSMGDALGGAVFALGSYRDTLLVGGAFVTAGADTVNCVAAWTGSGWRALAGGVTGGDPGVLGGPTRVQVVHEYAGSLYVGGMFLLAGADTVRSVARWDGAAWHDLDGGVWLYAADRSQGVVFGMCEYGGALVVAGSYLYEGSHQLNTDGVAKWNGANWSGFGPGITGDVYGVCVVQGSLVAGGQFTMSGRQGGFHNVARWSGQSWRSLAQGLINTHLWLGSTLYSLASYRDSLVVAGHFEWDYTKPQAQLATWAGTQWHPMAAGAAPSWDATCVQPWNDMMAIGGAFTQAGVFTVSGLVFWTGDSLITPGSGTDGAVLDLDVYQGKLIVAGDYTHLNGQSVNRLAAWDGVSWTPLGTGCNAEVLAIQPWNGLLVAAGDFTAAGGQAASHIAAWNGTAWQPLGGGLDGRVWGLGLWNAELVALGEFSSAGGVPAPGIALWDGTQWTSCGGGLGGGHAGIPTGYAAVTYHGELVVGGDFDSAGGVPARRLAAWNGSTWRQVGGGVGGTFSMGATRVLSLLVDGPYLTVGGLYSTVGDSAISYVARWDGAAWHGLGVGLTMHDLTQGPVWGLGLWNGALWIAGDMAAAGGVPSHYVAAWSEGDLVGVAPPAPVPGDAIQLRVTGGVAGTPATVAFHVPRTAHVRLTLFDAAGRAVARLLDATLPAGEVRRLWPVSGSAWPARGSYDVHLEVGREVRTAPLVWTR